MSPLLADTVAILLAFIAGWLVPAVAMTAMAPALEDGRRVPNFRGRPVFLGLGAVWMTWVMGLLGVRVLLEATGTVFPSLQDALFHLYSGALGVLFSGMPLLLVVTAFAFGLVDDAFGTSGHKGFRGHLRALASGRLTTGALKLFGIGVVAMFYGWTASGRVVEVSTGVTGGLMRVLAWALATLVIGLSANTFNLLDLRPGRALKSYVLVAVPLSVAFALRVLSGYSEFAASMGDTVGAAANVGPAETVSMIVASLLILVGPVVAMWRYDLGERGMLGDAGANVLGVIVGFLLVGIVPFWGYVAAAVVLMALNLASEKVSFSRVIEDAPVLRWVDSLGRVEPEEGVGSLDTPDGSGETEEE